jgi:hypothetical protein
VQVPEVEQHPGRRRGEPADEVAHRERVVAAPPRARVHGREVLDRERDAERLRPLEKRDEGPLLELGALAQARGRRAVCLREVQAVVGDELGARLGGVVEQPVERLVGLAGARAEVVGRVEQQAQPGRVERAAQGAGVAARAPAVGEHRRRRRVDLHPGEAGVLVGGEQLRRGPGVAVDVEAEASDHARSVARPGPRRVVGP